MQKSVDSFNDWIIQAGGSWCIRMQSNCDGVDLDNFTHGECVYVCGVEIFFCKLFASTQVYATFVEQQDMTACSCPCCKKENCRVMWWWIIISFAVKQILDLGWHMTHAVGTQDAVEHCSGPYLCTLFFLPSQACKTILCTPHHLWVRACCVISLYSILIVWCCFSS